MVALKSNHRTSVDFLRGVADLNKNVFINLRKQIRQKMEGVGASQF